MASEDGALRSGTIFASLTGAGCFLVTAKYFVISIGRTLKSLVGFEWALFFLERLFCLLDRGLFLPCSVVVVFSFSSFSAAACCSCLSFLDFLSLAELLDLDLDRVSFGLADLAIPVTGLIFITLFTLIVVPG